MNTSTPHQIEKKELFTPTISDEQICAKFREGENIYNIVNWYSNITGKGIEESKDIIVRLLFDRSDMGDYAKEVLLNTDYYNYIMEGITPPQNLSQTKDGAGYLNLWVLYWHRLYSLSFF